MTRKVWSSLFCFFLKRAALFPSVFKVHPRRSMAPTRCSWTLAALEEVALPSARKLAGIQWAVTEGDDSLREVK
ncbi:hypothetical protein [Xanthomonas floridensis]|uniref:hypothetical protein n=1 Tax=Xanthomonas floridensis TaxID=1843580 RepID=UPI002B211E28|nr:hypothetical protein [Xanthomonas floridensis]